MCRQVYNDLCCSFVLWAFMTDASGVRFLALQYVSSNGTSCSLLLATRLCPFCVKAGISLLSSSLLSSLVNCRNLLVNHVKELGSSHLLSGEYGP